MRAHELTIAKRRVIIDDSKVVANRPNSTVALIDYRVGQYLSARLEMVTYGGNYHNAAYSLYNNCGINQHGECCIDKSERDGFRNHQTVWSSDWFGFICSLEYAHNIVGHNMDPTPVIASKVKKSRKEEDVVDYASSAAPAGVTYTDNGNNFYIQNFFYLLTVLISFYFIYYTRNY